MPNTTRIIRDPQAQAGIYTAAGLGLNGEDNASLLSLHWTGTRLEVRSEDESLADPPTATAQLAVQLLPRLGLTANVGTLAGLQTLQGVTLVDGDIVLLTAQNTQTQNGPWQVHANDADGNATAWTRPRLPIFSGQLAEAQAGTSAGVVFRLVTQGTITLGSTALTYDSLLTSTSTLPTASLADGAVTAAKLATGAVTGVKLAAGFVKPFYASGRNGAGAVNIVGAKVGDTVVAAVNHSDVSDGASSFEATITVADQIQQSAAGDLSSKKFVFWLKVNS